MTRLHLIIGAIVLVGLLLFGFGGYYFGKRSSKNATEPKQSQTAPLPSPSENNGDAWKTYENVKYELEFDYPQNYVIFAGSDCGALVNDQSACLLALTLNPGAGDYAPRASFWLLRGIASVNISGQVNSISFDLQKRTWILSQPVPPVEVLPIWDRTKSGQEIIKSSNGGSHGSSYYYIIPKYENDEVAIFAIPQSSRLRCDNFINDKPKETDCNNFYKSVINRYNKGELTADMWLPENYLSSIYSGAENTARSYRETAK